MTAKRGITLVAPMPPSKRPRNNDKQNHPPLSIAEELSDNTLESEAEDVNNGVAIKEHNHSPQDGGNGDVDVPNLLPPSRLVSDAGGDEKVEDSATSSLAADKSKESQLDAELSPERLADNFWTRLTTTPWEANEKEKASRSRVRGGDGVFKDKDQWEPALVQRLYSMTSFDAIVDDGVGAIECFTPGDSKFVFTGKPLSLGYRRASQNIKAGQALRFLFTGVVKDAHQWSDNYMLNLVPLTRLGFKRAKEVLKYYSSKKVHALAIEEHFIPLKAWTLVSKDFKAIYDASQEYSVDHQEMPLYKGPLQPGDVVAADCSLEKYTEKSSGVDKVGFKLVGISFICEGDPPVTGLSLLGSSPSKKKL